MKETTWKIIENSCIFCKYFTNGHKEPYCDKKGVKLIGIYADCSKWESKYKEEERG